jgi:hypothetical protein
LLGGWMCLLHIASGSFSELLQLDRIPKKER